MSQITEKPQTKKTLKTVPFEKGFHFTKNGEYTGQTATNLPEFASALEKIDVESILFHYPRGDFQNWVQDTLGDKRLAEDMNNVPSDSSGEEMRRQLVGIVKRRIRTLRNLK